MNKHRQVLLYPGEDGFWVVECPSLPGCRSQGANKAEALNNIREAIDLYIESLRADGLPVPEDLFHAELVPV
jgi:predicted RNase H-like HicB family nuclease